VTCHFGTAERSAIA